MQTASSESLNGWNLEKPLMSLCGTEWRERGFGLVVKPGLPGNHVFESREFWALARQNGIKRLSIYNCHSATKDFGILYKQIMHFHYIRIKYVFILILEWKRLWAHDIRLSLTSILEYLIRTCLTNKNCWASAALLAQQLEMPRMRKTVGWCNNYIIGYKFLYRASLVIIGSNFFYRPWLSLVVKISGLSLKAMYILQCGAETKRMQMKLKI